MKKNISLILASNKVKKYLNVICNRQDLREDLLQFCILKLLEKDINVLNKILKNSQKTIEDYFIGMMVYQIKSNTSEFFKVYRNYGFTKNIVTDTITEYDNYGFYETDEDTIGEWAKEKILLKKIEVAMRRCDPLKIDLFKMKYHEDKTYREIAEYYEISQDSVVNKIKSVKKTIKDMLNKEMSFSELRKKDHELRRIKLGKIVITETVKLEIVNRYMKGEKKINLAKEYEISYPLVIKIIKDLCGK